MSPDELLASIRRFMPARVILTATELDLFRPGEASLAEIVRERRLDERATRRLLDALVALGLMTKRGQRYRTTETGAVLASGHPQSIRPMVLHQQHLWENWHHLTAAVQRGRNPQSHPGAERPPERLRAFIEGMHVVARARADAMAEACDLSGRRRLLDVGAGPGTYSIAFLRRNPGLRAVLFDLPDVLPITREYVDASEVAERVTYVGGDYIADELPGGCDVAWLSAVIHSNSPARNASLYARIHRALEPSGRLLIRDHVMSEDRTAPPAGTLFALNMLVSTEGGDCYTFSEIESGLREAGFTKIRLVHRGEQMDGLVEAVKE